MKENDKGLIVGVWLDFVKYKNGLRFLGRPYEEKNEDIYLQLWKKIGN